MIDLKIDSVQWSPNETSLIVKFAEPAQGTDPAATHQETLRCYVRVPVTKGENLLSAMLRARAMLTDATIVMTRRTGPLN